MLVNRLIATILMASTTTEPLMNSAHRQIEPLSTLIPRLKVKRDALTNGLCSSEYC